VSAEPNEEHKFKEEVDLWVVTQRGIRTGVDLQKGKCSGKHLEGKIKKVT